jgi:hypothetical protein
MAYDSTKPSMLDATFAAAFGFIRENFRAIIAGEVPFTSNVQVKALKTPIFTITPSGASPVYNSLAVGRNGFVRIVTGATGTITVNGIAAGQDGDHLVIFNNSGLTVNFAFNNASAANADKIYNAANATVALANGGALSFIYESANAKWIMIAK